jgi:hypothetical protein
VLEYPLLCPAERQREPVIPPYAATDGLDRVGVALCDAGDPTGRPFQPINPRSSHRGNQRDNALEPITGVNAVVISR